jgi:hypothetical protein
MMGSSGAFNILLGVIDEQIFHLWQAEWVIDLNLHVFVPEMTISEKILLFMSPLNGEMAYMSVFVIESDSPDIEVHHAF